MRTDPEDVEAGESFICSYLKGQVLVAIKGPPGTICSGCIARTIGGGGVIVGRPTDFCAKLPGCAGIIFMKPEDAVTYKLTGELPK